MARKKIVFVIVEGPSDDLALSLLLSKIYDMNKVYVHIWHGDITSESNVNPGNVISKIGDVVKEYAEANHLNNTHHFAEIIHIVDMDGAYISDDDVTEESSLDTVVYSLDNIKCKNRADIIDRNQRKRKNLDKLSSCAKIWSLPYHVYYMSCNLDHVLYNKLNTSDEEKEQDAFVFAKKYENDVQGFLEFIRESDFSIISEYMESWEFIKKEKNSLGRYCNLGIAFEEQYLKFKENEDSCKKES